MVEQPKHLLLLLLQRLQLVNQLVVVNQHRHRTVTKVHQLNNRFQQLRLKQQHHPRHHNVINVKQLTMHPKLLLLVVNQRQLTTLRTKKLLLLPRLQLLPRTNKSKVKRKSLQAENEEHQNQLQLRRKNLVVELQ